MPVADVQDDSLTLTAPVDASVLPLPVGLNVAEVLAGLDNSEACEFPPISAPTPAPVRVDFSLADSDDFQFFAPLPVTRQQHWHLNACARAGQHSLKGASSHFRGNIADAIASRQRSQRDGEARPSRHLQDRLPLPVVAGEVEAAFLEARRACRRSNRT